MAREKIISHIFKIVLLFFIFLYQGIYSKAYGQDAEICNNGLDDDGDGLIDLHDADCYCDVFEPISKIPNPSFEDIDCCPSSRSQLYCATGWIQASQATTDLIHECGWPGWPNFQPPRPFPEGEGIVGFRDGRSADNSGNIDYQWKEYAGACLNDPLLTNNPYRFEFHVGFINAIVSPALSITLYGTTSCEFLPFGLGDEKFGCPTNSPNWDEIGSVKVGWNHGWKKAAIEITPKEDYYAIAIGPPCENTSANTSTYYYFDKLVLDEEANFSYVISQGGHPCNETYFLSIPERPGNTYQWYKNGIAIPGQTNSTIFNITEGEYQARIETGMGCLITGKFNHKKPVLEDYRTYHLCEGDTYLLGDQIINRQGDYVESFISNEGCDSVVYLTVEELYTIRDTVRVKIFRDETYNIGNQKISAEGEHVISLLDDAGCDLFVHLFLDFYEVYWPNVFSPNGDGNNDFFTIYGGPEIQEIKALTIYNRWGGRVFELRDALSGNQGWDGTQSGQKTNGIFVFTATLIMKNGTEKTLLGSVVVM